MASLEPMGSKFNPLLLCILSVVGIIALSILLPLGSVIQSAYAHVSRQFGNLTVEVGWKEEPPLVGELNNAIIQVDKVVTGGNSTHVRNALADIEVTAKYGGVTKPIDFEPSEQSEGLYEGKMIPTRIGSYSLIMNGTIQGQNISNADIPLDDVEGKQKISFPDIEGAGNDNSQTATANNNIGSRVEGILSQLSNDIDSTKSDIRKLDSNYSSVQKSIQDIKSASDRSYIIGMTGVGAGIAGIIISAAILSRRGAGKLS
jgi:hypothetical protein